MCNNCFEIDGLDKCKVGLHLDYSEKGGPDIYVKNVSALICSECGEVFFTDDVTMVLKDIKEGLTDKKGKIYIDFDLIRGGIVNV